MSKSRLHVVLATDENYAQHTGVTIMSLLCNTKCPEPMTINVIDNGMTETSVSRLREIVEAHNAEFTRLRIDNDLINKLHISRYINATAYCRLLIPDILPEEADRAIYLDSDVIVRTDIKRLWEVDISGYHAAAVVDIGIERVEPEMQLRKRLGMPPGEPYLNSGVLYINLKKWRSESIGSKVIQFILDEQTLPYHDQDGLNAIIWGKWLHLNPKWNVYKGMFHKYFKRNRHQLLNPELIAAVKDPYIVHFTGPIKPWHYACAVPFCEEYDQYLKMTPWSGYRPVDICLGSFLKKHEWVLRRKIWG